MEMDMSNFNEYDVEALQKADQQYAPIPKGSYHVVIKDCEKITNTKNQACLQLVYRIVRGEFENRLIWDRISLEGEFREAGIKRLQAIQAACGFAPKQCIHSSQLKNKALHIGVWYSSLEKDPEQKYPHATPKVKKDG